MKTKLALVEHEKDELRHLLNLNHILVEEEEEEQ